jgi:hypothetical protein
MTYALAIILALIGIAASAITVIGMWDTLPADGDDDNE